MSNKTVINNKISEIQKYLITAEAYVKYSRAEIENNDIVRLSLERLLFLLVQATIDLGEMTIAYRQLRKATSLREIFQILKENNIIPRELEEKLISMTGFRNIIVHDYAKINYDRVYEVLHKDLEDIKKFIKIVLKLE